MRPLLLFAILLSGCGEHAGVSVLASDIRITEPAPGQTMVAGYLTLTNNTDNDIVITKITSNAFAKVAMHESSVENGISRMRPLESLLLEKKSSTVLSPGGKHLMLMDRKVQSNVTLSFYSDETMLLEVTVTPDKKDAH